MGRALEVGSYKTNGVLSCLQCRRPWQVFITGSSHEAPLHTDFAVRAQLPHHCQQAQNERLDQFAQELEIFWSLKWMCRLRPLHHSVLKNKTALRYVAGYVVRKVTEHLKISLNGEKEKTIEKGGLCPMRHMLL